MARITIEVDDALLGAAAHALGTQEAEDTVRAALNAAIRGGTGAPPLPRQEPPVPGRTPLDPPPVPPGRRSEFPYPPEIH
jgi:hypothetical protein